MAAFNHPAADDFAYAARDKTFSYAEVFKQEYFEWTGRYFSTITVFRINPLIWDNLILYKLYSLLLLLLLMLAFYSLIQAFTKPYLKRSEVLSLSLVLVLLYLTLVPSPVEAFYFFSTYTTYQLPNALLISLLLCLKLLFTTKENSKKLLYATGASLLIIAIVGSNEMALIITFTTLLFVLVLNWQDSKQRPYLLLLFILCLICCLTSVFAPGNLQRMENHPNAAKPLWSAAYAFSLTIISFYRWGVPLLIVSILYLILWGIPLAKKAPIHIWLRQTKPTTATAYYIATIFLMYFVFAWSTGERATPRLENVITFFILCGWFFLLQLWITRYLNLPHNYSRDSPATSVLTGFSLILLLLHTLAIENNIITAYTDLVSGKAAAYNNALEERHQYLSRSTCSTCAVPPLPALPATLHFMDMEAGTANADMWINEGVAAYYHKKAVYLSAPNPEVKDNLSTLREAGKSILKEKKVIE